MADVYYQKLCVFNLSSVLAFNSFVFSQIFQRNQKPKMADNTQKMSYQAGETKGQAQVSL